jgi:hypothetical protein
MRMVAALALACLMAACSSGNPTAVVQPTPTGLSARPLHLPVLKSDQACPTSAFVMLGGTSPRVGTPVRFGFGRLPDGEIWPQSDQSFNKVVWDLAPGQAAPKDLLLRGARIDPGLGRLGFGGNDLGQAGAGDYWVKDPQGVKVNFYTQLATSGSGGAFYVDLGMQGCYAIQADSASFSAVVVFWSVK